jgi:pimeloyl-ACP methyl ester carboxylesterase
VTERMIPVRGVQLCAESFGDPGQPAVLLIMGTGASMLWWEDGFCRELAATGRYVLRYDHRDTGRSVSYPPRHPGYDSDALVEDAVGVLDAFSIGAAHLVGVSAGGALAQLVALDHPDRVLTLTLISTTFAQSTPRSGGLPGPTPRFTAFLEREQPDGSDRAALVDYLVAYAEVLSGGRRPFPEREVRALVRADVQRARDPASAQNHDLLADGGRNRRPLASMGIPTLIVHGTADPMFPLPHGQALAEEIPGARLLVLADAGHGVERADWAALALAIRDHTSGVSGVASSGVASRGVPRDSLAQDAAAPTR